MNREAQEGEGGVKQRRRFCTERSATRKLPFWRVGGILDGNSKSTDFCTPINHYYWNVPEGIRRMNQLHTQPNFEMEKEKRKKREKEKR